MNLFGLRLGAICMALFYPITSSSIAMELSPAQPGKQNKDISKDSVSLKKVEELIVALQKDEQTKGIADGLTTPLELSQGEDGMKGVFREIQDDMIIYIIKYSNKKHRQIYYIFSNSQDVGPPIFGLIVLKEKKIHEPKSVWELFYAKPKNWPSSIPVKDMYNKIIELNHQEILGDDDPFTFIYAEVVNNKDGSINTSSYLTADSLELSPVNRSGGDNLAFVNKAFLEKIDKEDQNENVKSAIREKKKILLNVKKK